MNDAASEHTVDATISLRAWDAFWFAPAPLRPIAAIRGILCLITAVYFVSCWSDAPFWYTDGGPLSPHRVSTFLQTAGVEDAAQWIISPLFLTDTLAVYRGYLVIGIIVAVCVASGRGGRIACWALWLLLVGWANRAMILSGLAETLLSLGLFTAAIGPPCSAWQARRLKAVSDDRRDWTAGFAQRLMAAEITLIGGATFVTMLAGRVWWSGIGAYALAAPAQDRAIDWTESYLVNTLVHESLTHGMMIALPLGLVLAWLPKTNRIGQALLIAWCIAVALLGSHWLYASVFATMVAAIRPAPPRQT